MSTNKTVEQQIAAYRDDIAICKDLRIVYEKQKQTEKPTKRLATALEKMGYHANFYIEFGMMHLYVSKPGTPYQDRLYLVWSNMHNGVRVSWWDSFAQEIERVDPSDYLERIEAERQHEPELSLINDQIAELQKQIDGLRSKATGIIAGLPVPTSAKLRKESFFWSNPSIAARERYPFIWPASK